MHLAHACFVLLLVSTSVTEATDWAETPEGVAKGVVTGVAKGGRQTEGHAPWPANKTKHKQKGHRKGWQSSRAKRQRSGKTPKPCCGSVVTLKATEPTGEFTRVIAGQSLLIKDYPSKASASPPVVTDLRVTSLALLADGRSTLGLAWTAPGGVFNEGTASDYIFRFSDNRGDLTQLGFDEAAECTLLHAEWEDLESILQGIGTPVAINVSFSQELDCDRGYFAALKAIDDRGTAGPVSNLANFTSTGMRFPAPFDGTISDLEKLIEEMSNRNQSQKTTKKMRQHERYGKMKTKLLKIRINLRKLSKKLRDRKQREQNNKRTKNRKRSMNNKRKLGKTRRQKQKKKNSKS
ncbi:uncharacterized protein LOC119597872 [Penaeus monodon]|uniref:uncharacterized protein LOC119597872 n=1 Tax=Penaeus monodon TaxID=6687 RepID=UPI0018A79FC7|nr:uncharacterized protein LOC119597872 [Penaeus monodon]